MKTSVRKTVSGLAAGFLIFTAALINVAGQQSEENAAPVVKRDLFKSPQSNKTALSKSLKTEDTSAFNEKNDPVQNPTNQSEIKADETGKAEPVEPARVTASGGDNLFGETGAEKNGIETSANKVLNAARTAKIKSAIAEMAATELYKVGVGDVLDIRLLNSNGRESTLFTVLAGGVLDYPLAGETLQVEGMTTEEISLLLSEKIKLYETPEVVVNVRDYASHKIYVSGLVERQGTKFLSREAVPLFTILAEALQQPEAAFAIIIRRDKQTEKVDLRQSNIDLLVRDGDVVKVIGKNEGEEQAEKFYYIAGGVLSPGQKNFHNGLTLTQAVLAAGGLTKNSHSRAIVFRQNSQGLLVSTEFNLKLIKTGKTPDPVLEPGDRIEIGN